MGAISQEFIRDLLSRCDLVEIIEARIPLRKRGTNYLACCPFHTEKTPSFTVTPAKQFYYCFGCGATGNALNFLMQYDRLSFLQAVELLAARVGLNFSAQAKTQPYTHYKEIYKVLEKSASFYEHQLKHSVKAIDYLKSRGLEGSVAKQFRLGYAPEGWRHLIEHLGSDLKFAVTAGLVVTKERSYDRFRNRIIFPIRDEQGRIIGFGGRALNEKDLPKYLNSPETPIFHKGHTLYGLFESYQLARRFDKILVVEGYLDVIALIQKGVIGVVGTLGTATTPSHLKNLFRASEHIIFCFDGDRAGRAAAWRALNASLPLLEDGLEIQFLFLPEGEDPDSWIRKIGYQAFQEALKQAISFGDFLLNSLSQSINLTQAEGRARFSNLALPLINQLPQGVLKQILLDQLALKVRINPERLQSFTENQSSKISQKTFQRSPMRWAIALLLQNPEFVSLIPKNYFDESLDLKGFAVFLELVAVLNKNPQINQCGIILEYWRDQPVYEILKRLAAWPIAIPESRLAEEFLGVLAHLKKIDKEKKIEYLLDKAQKEELTLDEKQYLQNLLKELKTHKLH